MSDAMTGMKMCEYIAGEIKKETGVEVDPLAIWNMSPNGDIWPIVALYIAVKERVEEGDSSAESNRMTH